MVTVYEPSPSKKRPMESSLLQEDIWHILNFPNTPQEGEKHLKLWPVLFTSNKDSQRRYLSLLQGELQGTRITLPTNSEHSFESIREECWGQFLIDLPKNLGSGSKCIAERGLGSAKWIDQWQMMEDGNSTCHVLALLEITTENDDFYFNDIVHQWTDSDDLNICRHHEWDMPKADRYPLSMLAKGWNIEISEKDPDSLQLPMDRHEGSESLDKDSPSRPLNKKKRGSGGGNRGQDRAH